MLISFHPSRLHRAGRRCLLLAVVLITLPLSAQSPIGADDRATVLRPGDVVKLTVWRNPELSGEFVVAEDGGLKHPLYQEVQVAGVPLAVARERVGTYLTGYITDPQFVLEPLIRVAIAGQVRNPNLYQLPPETTIGEAIALAGGATENGRLDRVHLRRGGRDIVFDLTRADAEWAASPVRSGDQIIVDRRRNWLRDVVAPAASIAGAVVSIISLITR